MEKTYWRKADNSGILYPLITTLSAQSIFELSAILESPVQPEVLKKAFVSALNRYPFFKTELSLGLFRAVFTENNSEPIVTEDSGVILGRINIRKNNNYLIKITYSGSAIFMKIFHGLTDGTGAMHFFKYLLCAYYLQLGVSVDLSKEFPQEDGEQEDAYERYYDKNIDKKGMLASANKGAAQVRGTFFKHEGMGIICGTCPIEQLSQISHKYGCSITVLLGAVALLAVAQTRETIDNKDYTLFLPVNLRRFFPTHSLLNFVSSLKCILPSSAEQNPESYIKIITQQLAAQLNEQTLKKELSIASTVARNPILRFFPLFIKRALIKFGRLLTKTTKQTMILSNLGKFELPKAVESHIKDMGFYLNCNKRTPVNCAVLSYCGNLRITFSRHIVEHKLEARFFAILRELGADFEVYSNYREDYDAL